MIRKGKIDDIEGIIGIFEAAVIDMEAEGIYQWDSIYPNVEVIANDIREGNLYVWDDESVVKGLIVLNEDEEEEYKRIKWQFNSGKHLVIHRLCVHPKYKGRGIAKLLITFGEQLAKENKYEAIRLDAFIPNERACRMYENAGYAKIGIVTFRKGKFNCYEKGLN